MNNVYDIIRNDLNEANSNYCYSTTNNLINQSSCYLTNYYKNDFNIGPSYNLGFNSTDECNIFFYFMTKNIIIYNPKFF
jgi:hypothetical protein